MTLVHQECLMDSTQWVWRSLWKVVHLGELQTRPDMTLGLNSSPLTPQFWLRRTSSPKAQLTPSAMAGFFYCSPRPPGTETSRKGYAADPFSPAFRGSSRAKAGIDPMPFTALRQAHRSI